MSNTITDKSQSELAIERTEKLLYELKQASDIVETKDTIMQYISDIDCCSDYEDNPFVLGDTDFAYLFIQSLERRGRTPVERWGPLMIRCAQVEHSDEIKEALEKLRKPENDGYRN
jgi:hypothetical protein